MSLGWGDGTWGANGWGGTLEATGDEATGTVGTVLPDRIVALIGVVTDGLVETITNGGVVVELTGNLAYGNAGYVDVPLSPLTADGFVGSVSAERTVSLTGAASSGSVGNVGLGTRSAALTGVLGTGSVGTVIAVYWKLIDDSQTANWQNINNSQTAAWEEVIT